MWRIYQMEVLDQTLVSQATFGLVSRQYLYRRQRRYTEASKLHEIIWKTDGAEEIREKPFWARWKEEGVYVRVSASKQTRSPTIRLLILSELHHCSFSLGFPSPRHPRLPNVQYSPDF
jgi:hypothetical protein